MYNIEEFFRNLSGRTLEQYGRVQRLEIPNFIAKLRSTIAETEIAFGSFVGENRQTPYELTGYCHFNLYSQYRRRGYQASCGIVIADDYQKKRLGYYLMEYGLEQMRKQGYKKIWLHVDADNFHAKKLYERLGFRAEGVLERDQRETDGTLVDVILMAKFL